MKFDFDWSLAVSEENLFENIDGRRSDKWNGHTLKNAFISVTHASSRTTFILLYHRRQ